MLLLLLNKPAPSNTSKTALSAKIWAQHVLVQNNHSISQLAGILGFTNSSNSLFLVTILWWFCPKCPLALVKVSVHDSTIRERLGKNVIHRITTANEKEQNLTCANTMPASYTFLLIKINKNAHSAMLVSACWSVFDII